MTTPDKIAYSIKKSAELISCSPYVVRNAVKAGELKHVRLGHRVLIKYDDLMAWLSSKTKTEL
jgi:excisionase family DNA binding protein